MENTQDLIGKLLPEGTQRDAIHIAVFPAVAGKDIYANDEVAYDSHTGKAFPSRDGVGIVDPFFKRTDGEWGVKKGERFFIFLFPNTVTGLKHNWEHPAFKEEPKKEEDQSQIWLRSFAMEYNMTYDELLRKLSDVASGQQDYITVNDMDAHGPVPPEVWEHYHNVTKTVVSETVLVGTSFSCSC